MLIEENQLSDDVTVIQNSLVDIGRDDVWRCLGANNGAIPSLEGEEGGMIALGRELVRPAAIYGSLPVAEVERSRVLY